MKRSYTILVVIFCILLMVLAIASNIWIHAEFIKYVVSNMGAR